jgi:hypothetical protein
MSPLAVEPVVLVDLCKDILVEVPFIQAGPLVLEAVKAQPQVLVSWLYEALMLGKPGPVACWFSVLAVLAVVTVVLFS